MKDIPSFNLVSSLLHECDSIAFEIAQRLSAIDRLHPATDSQDVSASLCRCEQDEDNSVVKNRKVCEFYDLDECDFDSWLHSYTCKSEWEDECYGFVSGQDAKREVNTAVVSTPPRALHSNSKHWPEIHLSSCADCVPQLVSTPCGSTCDSVDTAADAAALSSPRYESLEEVLNFCLCEPSNVPLSEEVRQLRFNAEVHTIEFAVVQDGLPMPAIQSNFADMVQEYHDILDKLADISMAFEGKVTDDNAEFMAGVKRFNELKSTMKRVRACRELNTLPKVI